MVDGGMIMNITYFRDMMVFLVKSVVKMLGNASWTVFNCSETIKKLKEEYCVEAADDALCGYEITYYEGEEKIPVYIVPALYTEKPAIFATVMGETKVFPVSVLNSYDKDALIEVHEFIKERLGYVCKAM